MELVLGFLFITRVLFFFFNSPFHKIKTFLVWLHWKYNCLVLQLEKQFYSYGWNNWIYSTATHTFLLVYVILGAGELSPSDFLTASSSHLWQVAILLMRIGKVLKLNGRGEYVWKIPPPPTPATYTRKIFHRGSKYNESVSLHTGTNPALSTMQPMQMVSLKLSRSKGCSVRTNSELWCCCHQGLQLSALVSLKWTDLTHLQEKEDELIVHTGAESEMKIDTCKRRHGRGIFLQMF